MPTKKDPDIYTKTKTGRKAPSRLNDRPIQRMMLKRIVQTGEEKGCWSGICKQRNYYTWKAKNRKAWEERISRAIAQHHNNKILADPNLKKMIIKSLVDDIRENKLKPAEKLKLLQYLPDIEE